MAETKPQRRAAESREPEPRTAVGTATELSDDVLQSVEDGQRVAIAAVRKFVDTVDQEIVDSALEMADRLVHTQYEFSRKVVDSAGKSLK